MAGRWQFWVDRGGTFTDCIGVSPDGERRTTKVLSSDRSPLLGIRQLLGLAADAPIPDCELRMGTTLATNALLERRGEPCVLAITRGLGDLLVIGDQTRPDLFALDVRKPPPLTDQVIEIDVRLAADGATLQRASDDQLSGALAEAHAMLASPWVAEVIVVRCVEEIVEKEKKSKLMRKRFRIR